MKLIILSSGTGRRLLPLTANTPKSLIDLGGGKTLLETNLNNAAASGVIDEVVLVIGYCADQVEAKIKKYRKEGMKIKLIYNPFYEVSNNLMTLWMAKSEMYEDFIVTNGDNIFNPIVFQELTLKNKNGIFLTTSHRSTYRDDDMKVILQDGLVEVVSKQIPNDKADAESVGLTLISGEKYREIFKHNLEELAREPEYINKFWLEVFNRMINKGVRVVPFEIDGQKLWVEIDFHGDLNQIIQSLLERKMARVSEDNAIKLTNELTAMNNPKIKEEKIKKILSLLPQDLPAIENIFQDTPLSVEESAFVLQTLKNYIS